jgi:hypothetical protein
MRDIRTINISSGQKLESDDVMTRIGDVSYRNIGTLSKVGLIDEGKALIVGNSLRVEPSTGMTVNVPSGSVFQRQVDVKPCLQTSAQTVTLDAASGVPRIDIIEAQIASVTDKTDYSQVATVASGGGGITISNEEIKRNIKYYLNVRKQTGTTTPTAGTAGTLTGSVAISGTIDLSDAYLLNISDGEDGSFQEIDCRGATPAATSRSEIIANINAAVGRTMASTGGGDVVVLTGNGTGEQSFFTIKPPNTDVDKDALQAIFGVSIGGVYKYTYEGSNEWFKLAEIDIGATTTTITSGLIRNVNQKSTWASGDDDIILDNTKFPGRTFDTATSTSAVDLYNYFDDTIIYGDLVSDTVLTITNNIPKGKKLTIVNDSSSYELTVSINSTFYSLSYRDNIEFLSTGSSMVEIVALGYRKQQTINSGGFWGDVIWGSSSTIIIKPKTINGNSWIGSYLSDGTYLEDTTSDYITVTLDATTLDAIGAVQNNSFYWPCAYKDSSGNLTFDFMFMPSTTISASNPTNDVSLTQLNSKDIRSLYPVGAEVCIWESTSKFETPIYDTTGASYTPISTDMQVASYPASNQIRLNANLTVANFTSPTAICYLVNGFQPIDCTTEAINSDIGSRGWSDTGIRIHTDGSGNILPFRIKDHVFYYTDGTGAADYVYNAGLQTFNFTGAYSTQRSVNTPPDKTMVAIVRFSAQSIIIRNFYETYGVAFWDCAAGLSPMAKSETLTTYGIISARASIAGAEMYTRGYMI